MADDPYLIKRYSNRKLYDAVRRRFTTLDDIAQLVQDGVQVLVRDHATGEDRTDEVLTQVLGRRVRSARGSGGSGASDLLTGLLRGPTEVARTVVDQIAPDTEEDEPEADSEADPEDVAGSESEDEEARTIDQQQAEIRELRDQVSQLTDAVTLLLQEKSQEREQRDDEPTQ